MRIVSWNCAQRAHLKMPVVLGLAPDLLVLPECARPDVIRYKNPGLPPWTAHWIGDNPNKGLGVFAFGAYRIDRVPTVAPTGSMFLPVRCSGPVAIAALATWAFNDSQPPRAVPNAASIERTVKECSDFLTETPCVMLGDFNASVVWDRPRSRSPFRRVINDLGDRGFSSAVHTANNWDFGAEKRPTFFDRTRDDLPHHIDYVFVRAEERWQIIRADVGDYDTWRRFSDHMPLVVDLVPRADLTR